MRCTYCIVPSRSATSFKGTGYICMASLVLSVTNQTVPYLSRMSGVWVWQYLASLYRKWECRSRGWGYKFPLKGQGKFGSIQILRPYFVRFVNEIPYSLKAGVLSRELCYIHTYTESRVMEPQWLSEGLYIHTSPTCRATIFVYIQFA